MYSGLDAILGDVIGGLPKPAPQAAQQSLAGWESRGEVERGSREGTKFISSIIRVLVE
jgi:hypothetical protein